MYAARFDQNGSSSGVSEIADEFSGYALVYAPMFNVKLLKVLKSILHARHRHVSCFKTVI
jgi:hypothetical protein